MDLKEILFEAVKYDVTDIFFNPGKPVIINIAGNQKALSAHVLTPADTEDLASQIVNEDQYSIFDQIGDFNLAFGMKNIGRFRANIYKQRGSVAMVLRRIKMKIPSMSELMLPDTLRKLMLRKNGLILVTGSTGSGKSTSVASLIQSRNASVEGHIVCLEDPIEFLYQHDKAIISQREIGLDTISYEEGLKNALRQSPDTIVIGEIRDAVSMKYALYAAETGHLVISTLHSTDAQQTVERIMSFFPAEVHTQVYMQLAYCLIGVISQRLIEHKNGVKRVPALEILLNSPRVQDMLLKQNLSNLKQVMSESEKEGMQTFDQALYALYQKDLISKETALKYADSVTNMNLKLKGINSITTI